MESGFKQMEFPELPNYLFTPTPAGLLSLALTVLLPTVAALFMRAQWSTFVKGLVLLTAAAVKTLLEALLAAQGNPDFDFYSTLYTILVNFGIAVVAYFGLLKHTTMQQSALAGGVVKSGPHKETRGSV